MLERLPYRASVGAAPYEGLRLPVAMLLDNVRSMYNVGLDVPDDGWRRRGADDLVRDHGEAADAGDLEDGAGRRRSGFVGTLRRRIGGGGGAARGGV